MIFSFGMQNKTVRQLRKNQNLTAKEVAWKLKLDTIDILKVDDMKLKDVPEPLKTKITPVLRGDSLNKVPW
ncbi:hypothetical protein SAMN05660649_04620 [Desulfotomaculum arcticum]|uniref:Transcriptional regulator n=1 Tax=Desulfotruncus arcticus DSM 17038 TaxID=1121424 RepID=A0A1I2YUV3_9FIRM|nr:transcriptional regulator [Desulfotruncus arcticus]SFH29453.1 hypothetical protein SAMN05660649_04620 [Desulfotomaculum arcticum] [Desulfotruncus arcticus DSM 17038]